MFLGSFFAVVALMLKRHSVGWLMKVPFVSGELREKAVVKARSFITGLEVIKSGKNFFAVILFALAVWMCETVNMFFLVRIVGIHLSLPVTVFILFVVAIGVAIPAAPSSIGTFEFFFVGGLVFFGITKETALACGLIIHFVSFSYIILFGAYYFFSEGISYREISKER
jgi:hypothetical protein